MNIGCGEDKSFAAMDKHPNGLEVKSSSLEYNIIQVNQTKYHITYSWRTWLLSHAAGFWLYCTAG